MWLLGFEINFWQIEGYVISVMLGLLVVRWSFYEARYRWRCGFFENQVITDTKAIGVLGNEVFASGEISEPFKKILHSVAYMMHGPMPHAAAYLFGGDHGHGFAYAHMAKRYACSECQLPETRVKTPTEDPIRGMWAHSTYHEVRNMVRVHRGNCVYLCQASQQWRVRIMLRMFGYNSQVIAVHCGAASHGQRFYEFLLTVYTVMDPHNFVLGMATPLIKRVIVPVWHKILRQRVAAASAAAR